MKTFKYVVVGLLLVFLGVAIRSFAITALPFTSVPLKVNRQDMIAIGRQQPSGQTIYAGIEDCLFSVSREHKELRDQKFGDNGKTKTELKDWQGKCRKFEHGAAAILPNQKIIIAGTGQEGSYKFITVACYTPEGQLDNSFGNEGTGVKTIFWDENNFSMASLSRISMDATEFIFNFLAELEENKAQ